MKKVIRAAVVTAMTTATLALAPLAQADGMYYGGNAMYMEYSEEGLGDDAGVTSVYGRWGTHFTENFSGELRLGLRAGDDTVRSGSEDVDIEIENFWGFFVRAGVETGDAGVFPYAIAGFSSSRVRASIDGQGADTRSESDLSFGAGVDIPVSETVTINAEYLRFFDNDGAELDGFSVGVSRPF